MSASVAPERTTRIGKQFTAPLRRLGAETDFLSLVSLETWCLGHCMHAGCVENRAGEGNTLIEAMTGGSRQIIMTINGPETACE